jgi:glycine cleavage system transcriptional repressor
VFQGWPDSGHNAGVNEYAIIVIGHDRPGIIAETTGILAGLGVNLTDSTMTRLRGHFAMTLVCAGEVPAASVDSALQPLTADGSLLVTVRQVGLDRTVVEVGVPFLLTVHGADRLGLVAALTRVLADEGGNITDLTTRLAGDLYLLVAEVDLPASVEAEALDARLRHVAASVGVDVTFRRAEADVL